MTPRGPIRLRTNDGEPRTRSSLKDPGAPQTHPLWSLAQRVTAGVALVALAPVFAMMFLLVKGTSKGPFIFSQARNLKEYRIERVYEGVREEDAVQPEDDD